MVGQELMQFILRYRTIVIAILNPKMLSIHNLLVDDCCIVILG